MKKVFYCLCVMSFAFCCSTAKCEVQINPIKKMANHIYKSDSIMIIAGDVAMYNFLSDNAYKDIPVDSMSILTWECVYFDDKSNKYYVGGRKTSIDNQSIPKMDSGDIYYEYDIKIGKDTFFCRCVFRLTKDGFYVIPDSYKKTFKNN